MKHQAQRATPELSALVDLFYDNPQALGTFQELHDADLPQPARRLLAHDQHMTVTLEEFHQCRVTLEVLRTNVTATHYARKILLHRESDRQIVLFGLVRLALALLSDDIRGEIESQETPLGHVLIRHNVLRTVRLLSLWQIAPGDDLCTRLGVTADKTCYGRTALIYCDGVPAVELLEIVTPS